MLRMVRTWECTSWLRVQRFVRSVEACDEFGSLLGVCTRVRCMDAAWALEAGHKYK